MSVKLLIHAPEPDALKRARANARNLLKEHPDAEVEIVVNAGAIKEALISAGDVTDNQLVLCNNSLIAHDLEKPEYGVVVKAAVSHIVERQQQGWAYMRA